MKGIILAGGRATRLGELTKVVSKQLLPIFKTPMIYYPVKTLKDMGIVDILVIVASELQSTLFQNQLGDGSKYGVNLSYVIQDKPNGLAEAFIIGEEFIGNDDVALILGDNVFLLETPVIPIPNTIFTYKVKNPSAYGVALLDCDNELIDIVEKPTEFLSENAVVGLYIFSNIAVELAKQLTPSKRGELEIVDLIKLIHLKDWVAVSNINGLWFDCGTPDDLLECAEFVRALDKRTNRDIYLGEI